MSIKNYQLSVPKDFSGFDISNKMEFDSYDIELNKEYTYKNEKVIVKRIMVRHSFTIARKWYQFKKTVIPTSNASIIIERTWYGNQRISALDLEDFLKNTNGFQDHVNQLKKITDLFSGL
jgi:hypothetical protein